MIKHLEDQIKAAGRVITMPGDRNGRIAALIKGETGTEYGALKVDETIALAQELASSAEYQEIEMAQIRASHSYQSYVGLLKEQYQSKSAPANGVKVVVDDRMLVVTPVQRDVLTSLEIAMNSLDQSRLDYVEAAAKRFGLVEDDGLVADYALRRTAPTEEEYLAAQKLEKQALTKKQDELPFNPASGRHY